MIFTPRLRQITLILLKENQIFSVKNLAERINVSKRTVQRELEYTGNTLKTYGLSLCSKTGVGIWLEGEACHKQELLKLLENQEELDSSDREERRKWLILELLKDQEPKKLYYFGNKLGVSEATISKDMGKIQDWFVRFNIDIVKKQGLGVHLSGRERDYRRAVREFIAENMDTPMIQKIYEGSDITAQESVRVQSIKNSYEILNQEILTRVCICFASIQDERITRLTEESYIGLVIHVTIAVERVRKGEIIEPNQELLFKLKKDADFQLALLMLGSLEEEFEIEIPDVELAYICLHIKGAKIQRSGEEERNELSPETREEIRAFVHEMIVAYDETIAEMLETDEEFTEGLAAHLRPTLVRLRNHMNITNPHLEEMKETYPDIYKRCLYVGKYMEARTGIEIPEAEIGFLTIHFGAALMRLEMERSRKRVVDIGLICASGIGISRLMESRLYSCMKSRVSLRTYGREDITPYVIAKEDFFVSSMSFEEMDADIINVSPLLPEQDLNKIEEKVAYYESQIKIHRQNQDFMSQLEKVNALSASIKDVLKEFRCVKVRNDVGFSDTVRDMTEKLHFSFDNARIIREDIQRREEIATQITPEIGIGLLHARTAGVTKPCIYIGTPEKEKKFLHPYFQEIEAIVLMLIPKDAYKEGNSRLIGNISQSLMEDAAFLALVKSGNEASVRSQLNYILKQYFKQYLDEVNR